MPGVTGLFILAVVISVAAAVPILLLPPQYRPLVFALVFALVATPSWAPATIVAVPVPFGFLLVMAVAGNALHEIPVLLAMFWEWHLVAFALVFGVSYLVYARISSIRTAT